MEQLYEDFVKEQEEKITKYGTKTADNFFKRALVNLNEDREPEEIPPVIITNYDIAC